MVMRTDCENSADPLEVFIESFDIQSWILFEIYLPLMPIGILILFFWGVSGIRESFAHILGEGIILIFSSLLLINVMRKMEIVSHFITSKLDIRRINRYKNIVLVIAITFLFCYAINIFGILCCELIKGMTKKKIFGRPEIWAWVGVVVGLCAIVLSIVGMLRVIRILHSSKGLQRKGA